VAGSIHKQENSVPETVPIPQSSSKEGPFEVMEAKQEVARASFKSLDMQEIKKEKEQPSPFK